MKSNVRVTKASFGAFLLFILGASAVGCGNSGDAAASAEQKKSNYDAPMAPKSGGAPSAGKTGVKGGPGSDL